MASARIHRIIACFACVHHSAAITSSVVDYHHSDIPNCINVAVIASRDCYRPRLRQRGMPPHAEPRSASLLPAPITRRGEAARHQLKPRLPAPAPPPEHCPCAPCAFNSDTATVSCVLALHAPFSTATDVRTHRHAVDHRHLSHAHLVIAVPSNTALDCARILKRTHASCSMLAHRHGAQAVAHHHQRVKCKQQMPAATVASVSL